MSSDGWFDIEAGPVVRPYAMTAGRTTGAFDLIAIVIAVRGPVPGDEAILGPEALEILRYAQPPVSVAEIAAHLDLPAGTVRVLLTDLLGMGLIHTRAPEAVDVTAGDLLEAVINGLRAL